MFLARLPSGGVWPRRSSRTAGDGRHIPAWTGFQNRPRLLIWRAGMDGLEGRILVRPFPSASHHFSCPSRRTVGGCRVSVRCCFTWRVREWDRLRPSSAQHLLDLSNQERQVGLDERQVRGGHAVVFDIGGNVLVVGVGGGQRRVVRM
jgi:hypothetical protein